MWIHFLKLNLLGVSLKGLVDMSVLFKEYSGILDKMAATCRLHKVTKDYIKELMLDGKSHIRLEILLTTTTFPLSFYNLLIFVGAAPCRVAQDLWQPQKSCRAQAVKSI
jgi:hypothetical protein